MQYYLTKSKYVSGQQCHKRLWNEVRHRERATDISKSQQRRFDQGTEVGILARKCFPDGVLIDATDPLVSVDIPNKLLNVGLHVSLKPLSCLMVFWLNAIFSRKMEIRGKSLK